MFPNVEVTYGFHGRLRDTYTLKGRVLTENENGFLVLMVDNKKYWIRHDKILEYHEEN